MGEARDHVMLLPQRLMNSYADNSADAENDEENLWRYSLEARQQLYADGDWIVHFAGSPHKDALVFQFTRKARENNNFLQAHRLSSASSCGKVLVPLSGW